MNDIEDIKINLFKNADNFWHFWGQETQDTLFKCIIDLYTFDDSWRLQEVKAKLIKTIVSNYNIDKLTSNCMLEKFTNLLKSDIYTVQKATAENITHYVLKVSNDGKKAVRKECINL
jgi:hypothetical protein